MGDGSAAPSAVRGALPRVLQRRAMRFFLVGVVNSLFSFGVFAALQITLRQHIHYLVVLAIAYVVGVLEAYVLQRWLVFRVSGHWWRDMAKFWSVYLVALGVNALALPALVEFLGVPVLLAQGAVMLATAVGTFVGSIAPSLFGAPSRERTRRSPRFARSDLGRVDNREQRRVCRELLRRVPQCVRRAVSWVSPAGSRACCGASLICSTSMGVRSRIEVWARSVSQ